MKIAFLTNDNREINRQYDVGAPWFGTAPQALLEGLTGLPEVEVHVVSCTQQPMKSPAKLAENIHFHSLHVPKLGWMRTGYQGCVRAVRRKLREIKPDIVHGQGTERDCAISAVFSGYPNVVTIHGKMTEIADLLRVRVGSFYWCAARLENFTLSRTDGIICISSYVKKRVEAYGVPLWIIPNALRRIFFDYPRAPRPPDLPRLINVGVVGVRKRQCEILQVLSTLRAQGLEFETVFVGGSNPGDPYAAQFNQELAAVAAAHGKFSHIPHLGPEELCHLFDTSSAIVHFAEQETFGLVFGEALARNLYLFASEVGSVRNIAEGVENVTILPVDDWRALSEALRRWLAAGSYRLPRAATAPQTLIDRYHPTAVALQHLQVYRDVLDREGL